jgi:hypothetical protein
MDDCNSCHIINLKGAKKKEKRKKFLTTNLENLMCNNSQGLFTPRVVSFNTTLCPILLLKPFKTLIINTPPIRKMFKALKTRENLKMRQISIN